MKFFKREDFLLPFEVENNKLKIMEASDFADLANAKLEKEAKVVYSYFPSDCDFIPNWARDKKLFYKNNVTHQALLINIEPIAKCEHPADKVRRIDHNEYGNAEFICDCNARVKPNSFVVVE